MQDLEECVEVASCTLVGETSQVGSQLRVCQVGSHFHSVCGEGWGGVGGRGGVGWDGRVRDVGAGRKGERLRVEREWKESGKRGKEGKIDIDIAHKVFAGGGNLFVTTVERVRRGRGRGVEYVSLEVAMDPRLYTSNPILGTVRRGRRRRSVESGECVVVRCRFFGRAD